jgi:hypothetical protein
MKRVEAGFAPKPAISYAERLERKGIRQLLLDLFSQEDPSKFYYVIKGHAGGSRKPSFLVYIPPRADGISFHGNR